MQSLFPLALDDRLSLIVNHIALYYIKLFVEQQKERDRNQFIFHTL